MRLGDVLGEKRERKEILLEKMADRLDLSAEVYRGIEKGEAEVERWGLLLGYMAIALDVPMTRLISESGWAADIRLGGCGKLIGLRRLLYPCGLPLQELDDYP